MSAPIPDLRYPVGEFAARDLDEAATRALIPEIAAQPAQLRQATEGLADAQLDTPYRPGGWTVRQVAHHVPDSHMNAYIRMRKAVTEEAPLISTYEEAEWAGLADAKLPLEVSFRLLEALHERWNVFMLSLDAEALARVFRHPEWGDTSVAVAIQQYEWHGRHHIRHITALREREGW